MRIIDAPKTVRHFESVNDSWILFYATSNGDIARGTYADSVEFNFFKALKSEIIRYTPPTAQNAVMISQGMYPGSCAMPDPTSVETEHSP